MPGGQFSIEVTEIEKDMPLQNGMDKINYLVSLNPGQPLQPLSKVASGGELSRISLAIQVTGSKDKGIPTLIFDEVDSGIGGGVAEIVGKLLHSLSDKRQVFWDSCDRITFRLSCCARSRVWCRAITSVSGNKWGGVSGNIPRHRSRALSCHNLSG